MTWWAFDIETEDWDKLVVGCALSEDGKRIRMDNGAEIRKWYRSLPSSDIVWAYNGGGYDYLYMISVCQPPDFVWTARMAGSAIVSCEARGYAQCRDPMRLFPGGLDRWTGRKEKLGLPCRCEKSTKGGCGGYCSIRRDMSRADWLRVVNYCFADCEALLATLRSDIERLAGEGLAVLGRDGLPRLTLGAVAWNTAQSIAGMPELDDPIEWDEYDSGRRAYYGGRCEVGRTHAELGHRYDVHAMYPWALTDSVPFGKRSAQRREAASRAYREAMPGAYRATVRIPETDIPPLPHRYMATSNKGRLTRNRLLWTTGLIHGWWTHLELQAAEAVGAEIQTIDYAYTWSDYQPIFAPYVEAIYAARDRAKRANDERWADALKWYANSLTGKLAQNPSTMTLKVTVDPEQGDGKQRQAKRPDLDKRRQKHGQWHWLGGNVWGMESRRLSPCSRPIMAAYLTSRARGKLLNRLSRHSGRWLYCDTDSTYLLDRDDTDVHESKLGTFGYEGPAVDWLCLAPKLYRYRDPENPKEKKRTVVRARGIPDPEWETLDLLRAGKTIERERGVERIKSSDGDFIKRAIKRSHRDHDTDRVGTRFVNPDGTTRPLHRRDDGEYV